MLEYLAYGAFVAAVFGCLYYIMDSLEVEGAPGDRQGAHGTELASVRTPSDADAQRREQERRR